MLHFQRALFQRDGRPLLIFVEVCGTLGFSHPQIHLHRTSIRLEILKGTAAAFYSCLNNTRVRVPAKTTEPALHRPCFEEVESAGRLPRALKLRADIHPDFEIRSAGALAS